VVGFAPFACLPGRLIRALCGPYLRKKGVPYIAVEADGFAYPPAVISRLEVFMLRVLRYGKKLRESGGSRDIATAEIPDQEEPAKTDAPAQVNN